jgi:hypothetical protein
MLFSDEQAVTQLLRWKLRLKTASKNYCDPPGASAVLFMHVMSEPVAK